MLEAATHEAKFLKGGQAAINSDQIAGTFVQVVMQLLNGDWRIATDKCFQNSHARFGDAHLCLAQTDTGGFQIGCLWLGGNAA